jgi:preprotein translocase subunit SecG
MQTVLIVVHLMIVLALVAVVLLQRSEGGALGVGGGSGFMTGRGQANVLTRATAILAAAFFITSLSLTVLAGLSHGQRSILDGAAPAAPGQPTEPAAFPKAQGNVLDQLRKLEDQRAGQPAAGRPSAPGAAIPPAAPAPPRGE